MKAWMPGEAKYVKARIEVDANLKETFSVVVEQMQYEMGGVPDEWRWEIDDGVVELTAAKALS